MFTDFLLLALVRGQNGLGFFTQFACFVQFIADPLSAIVQLLCQKARHFDEQQDADEQRRQLLDLADQVKDWRERIQRADRAGATDLADRARHHLDQLMTQGRHLWSDLENLGRRFEEVDGQLAELSRQPASANRKDLDRDPGDRLRRPLFKDPPPRSHFLS